MQYQSPGFATADSLYNAQMDRAALQHQVLLEDLAVKRQAQEEKYTNAELETMRLSQHQKERDDFVKEVRGSMVPGDIPPPEWLEKDRKLGTHLFDASGPQNPLATGNVVMRMPASPTTAPSTVPSAPTYRGTPEQVSMRTAASSMPQGPMRSAMEAGAPESVVRIAATEQERRDALAQRAEEFAESQANRVAIAAQQSADREAAQKALAEYHQQTAAAQQMYRQNQMDEQRFRQEMAKATLDLKRQIFETTKANDLTPTQRSAYNKILAEKIKAATPSTVGGLMNGGNWSVPDDQMDQILQDAYNEAKGVGAAPPADGNASKKPSIVSKVKGIIGNKD